MSVVLLGQLTALTEKHLQRAEQRLRIVLALINGRRRGAALEQKVNRFPRRAGRVFDGERHIPRNLDVLADESEIGRPLRNHGEACRSRLRGIQMLFT